jgi:hypothetical protein
MSRKSGRGPHRRRRAATAAAVVLACLASCGTQIAAGDLTQPKPVSAGVSGLDGTWHLEAEGEPSGAVLVLSLGDLMVFRPCEYLPGTWAARDGIFLAQLPEGEVAQAVAKHGCPSGPRVEPRGWLTRAVRYERVDDGWRLLAANGGTVATLRPGAKYPDGFPYVKAYIVQEFGDPHVGRPREEERQRLNSLPAAPLPSGVRAAAREELVGRWEPAAAEDPHCDRPYLVLRADGTWTGRRNGLTAHGHWLTGADGLALGFASEPEGDPRAASPFYLGGGSTTVDAGAWMMRLARLGFRGDHLVLFDPDGIELVDLTSPLHQEARPGVDGRQGQAGESAVGLAVGCPRAAARSPSRHVPPTSPRVTRTALRTCSSRT